MKKKLKLKRCHETVTLKKNKKVEVWREKKLMWHGQLPHAIMTPQLL